MYSNNVTTPLKNANLRCMGADCNSECVCVLYVGLKLWLWFVTLLQCAKIKWNTRNTRRDHFNIAIQLEITSGNLEELCY